MKSAISICPDLTIEMCCDLFAYNPKSGILTWRKPAPGGNRRVIGAPVGQINRKKYRVLKLFERRYQVHHLIWATVNKRWPSAGLDHIDGNPLNNKIENLREATSAQNARNKNISRRNKSGFKGVSWHKGAGKWVACIMADGAARHLGLFDKADDAAAAYDAAAKELHGEFALTNAMIESRRVRTKLTGKAEIRMYDPSFGVRQSRGLI